MEFQLVNLPLTWFHKEGIVSAYSKSEMVNPTIVQDISSQFLVNGIESSHHKLSAGLALARKGHSRRRRKT